MANLKELRRDLGRALEESDLDSVASVRRTIFEAFPQSPDGAEASYKLGLDALFRSQNLDQAESFLRAAAQAKAPPWSLHARSALAQVLLRQGKSQQAVFELRRVAGSRPVSMAAALASGVLVMTLRDLQKGAEAERARGEQLKALTELTRSDDEIDASLAHYMLGVEHRHDGERAKARHHIEKALALGGLSPEIATTATSALTEL